MLRIILITFHFVFLLSSPANAGGDKSHFLLGFSKQHIKSFIDFKEDCFADIDRSISVIEGVEAEKIFPFYLRENEYIELEFNSCSSKGVVTQISIPIDESKFKSLKDFYTLAYGKPQLGSHGNDLTWKFSSGRVSIIKLSKSRYIFVMAL